MSSDQEIPAPPSVSYGSPGSSIQAARKRVGMSIEELASRTRLAKALRSHNHAGTINTVRSESSFVRFHCVVFPHASLSASPPP